MVKPSKSNEPLGWVRGISRTIFQPAMPLGVAKHLANEEVVQPLGQVLKGAVLMQKLQSQDGGPRKTGVPVT